jgi:hypothetical protein
VRPEEAFGADWADVDLAAGIFTVRRAFAKGRLKAYPKTERSRRRVPLRAKVLDALHQLPEREGIAFSSPGGGRSTSTTSVPGVGPALKAAGLPHRRIYDMRHTFATWSLAAGMSIFTLARRMGTSLQMIDRTYGHLAQDALLVLWAIVKRPILSVPIVAYVGLVVWLGEHDVQALVLWALLALVVWRLVHKHSFQRLVGRPLRTRWRRLWVYDRRWRSTMVLSGLGKRHRLREGVPKIRKVESSLWRDRVLIGLLPWRRGRRAALRRAAARACRAGRCGW